MAEEKPEKNNRVFYINHSGELLFWLIILLFAIIIFTVHNIKYEEINNDYTILIPDVDGLIVGSPVRMMGIEVGHITKIKPANDQVFVKFLITNKDISLPQGTQATVEFNGMAGSKSLELYPPDESTYIDENTPILTVNPPKRLQDAVGLLNEMFKQVGSIITTSSLFGKKLKTIDLPKGNPQDFSEFLKYTNNVLDTSIERTENLEKKVKKYGK